MDENEQNFTVSTFNRKEFSERIRAAIPKGTTLKEVSESVGVSLSGLKKWLGGDAEPSVAPIAKFAQLYGVSLDWLATGEGPMRAGEIEAAPTTRSPELMVDEELFGRCSDGFSRLYKEMGIVLSPLDLGRLAAVAYNEIAVAETDEERRGALKLLLSQHRRRILAEGTANSQGKRSAS